MTNKRQLKKAMAECVNEAILEAYLQLNFTKDFTAEQCEAICEKATSLYSEAVNGINCPTRKDRKATRAQYNNIISTFNAGMTEIEKLLGR
ncbi:MAG: hypothetical protein MJZ98_04845 [Paludibacteraceae bacterium]|nr:hypothetical protein [Paludibacteraceae bacterium]